jgi:pyruvate/2-oxoglutarate dehydrogenase complex dihydrolipoamide acyltransferase (E2) component
MFFFSIVCIVISEWYCWYTVLVSIFLAVVYLVRLQVGIPLQKMATQLFEQPPAGQFIFRFSINTEHLQDYLQTDGPITFTHLVLKACAMTISEIPSLNGHILMNQFYRSKTPGIDVSLFADVQEKITAAVKIVNADLKSTKEIAEEVVNTIDSIRRTERTQQETHRASAGSVQSQLTESLSLLSRWSQHVAHAVGNQLGIDWQPCGIHAFPYGVCTILTASDIQSEIDLFFTTAPTTASSAPMTLSMGAIRTLPTLDTDRRLRGQEVMDFVLAIDNRAATATDAKKCMERIRTVLEQPLLIEEAHNLRMQQQTEELVCMVEEAEKDWLS